MNLAPAKGEAPWQCDGEMHMRVSVPCASPRRSSSSFLHIGQKINFREALQSKCHLCEPCALSQAALSSKPAPRGAALPPPPSSRSLPPGRCADIVTLVFLLKERWLNSNTVRFEPAALRFSLPLHNLRAGLTRRGGDWGVTAVRSRRAAA